VVRYLCSRCAEIVRLDLILDEVKSSTAATSFSQVRRQRTVLVIDDAAATRRVAADILRVAGHRVLVARDGDAGLQHALDEHPDGVVIALMARGRTADYIQRRLHTEERAADAAVLIMSGVHKPEVVKVLVDLGAAGFIDKERLVETLAFRVQTALAEKATETAAPDDPPPTPGPNPRQ
jgi:two-component system chemotaxis response regulator CheY